MSRRFSRPVLLLQTHILCLRMLPSSSRATTIPPELLSKIFLEHIALYSHHHDDPPYGWISVMLVCKYWRLVTISNPQLWADIYVPQSLQWAELCLSRSQHTPLRVSHNTHARHHPASIISRRPSFFLILAELPRIRSLHLIFSSFYDREEMEAIRQLNLPRPLLQTLHVQHTEIRPQTTSILNVLLENATNIQKLRIVGGSQLVFPPTSKFLGMLTHLTIDASNFDHNAFVCTNALDILSATPFLKVFEVSGLPLILRTQKTTPIHPGDRTVMLPHLHILRTRSAAVDTAVLLNHLSLPSIARISVISDEIGPRHSADLARSLNGVQSPNVPANHLKAFVVNQYSDGHDHIDFSFFGWTTVPAYDTLRYKTYDSLVDGDDSWNADLDVDLQVRFKLPVDVVRHQERTFVGFCGELVMPNLEVAIIGPMQLRDYKDCLLAVATSLHNIHTLIIEGRQGRGVPVLLMQEPPLVPLLQTLRLNEVRMIEPDATSAQFVQAFASRRAAGLGLTKLVLEGCSNVTALDVAVFRKDVDEVEWDEEELHDSGNEHDSIDSCEPEEPWEWGGEEEEEEEN